ARRDDLARDAAAADPDAVLAVEIDDGPASLLEPQLGVQARDPFGRIVEDDDVVGGAADPRHALRNVDVAIGLAAAIDGYAYHHRPHLNGVVCRILASQLAARCFVRAAVPAAGAAP